MELIVNSSDSSSSTDDKFENCDNSILSDNSEASIKNTKTPDLQPSKTDLKSKNTFSETSSRVTRRGRTINTPLRYADWNFDSDHSSNT